MVQEQFRKQTQVLAKRTRAGAIDLEDGDVVAAVNLISWRVQDLAALQVALKRLAPLHEVQVVLAKE